jgi:hypothetical protein
MTVAQGHRGSTAIDGVNNENMPARFIQEGIDIDESAA